MRIGDACDHSTIKSRDNGVRWLCNGCGMRFYPETAALAYAALQTVVGEVEQAIRGEQRPEDCVTDVGRWAAWAAEVRDIGGAASSNGMDDAAAAIRERDDA